MQGIGCEWAGHCRLSTRLTWGPSPPTPRPGAGHSRQPMSFGLPLDTRPRAMAEVKALAQVPAAPLCDLGQRFPPQSPSFLRLLTHKRTPHRCTVPDGVRSHCCEHSQTVK